MKNNVEAPVDEAVVPNFAEEEVQMNQQEEKAEEEEMEEKLSSVEQGMKDKAVVPNLNEQNDPVYRNIPLIVKLSKNSKDKRSIKKR
jgi:hypothetical protein